MAKEFDREARKERQGAGEHRADAVGLLTPALLRKHIKSGTDPVLAYGKKGATVSYTVDDLKRFVEARERADKVVGVDIPLHLEEQHISAHLVEQGGFHFL